MPKTQASTLETRTMVIRAADVDTDKREITGVAVPFNTPTELIPGLREQFLPGSVRTDDQIPKLCWQHDAPIGTITTLEDRQDGCWITARLSKTPTADDALTLVRDGVIDRLSVGFIPISDTVEHDGDGDLISRSAVMLREVSLVTFPAYPGAKVTGTRSIERTTTMPETDTETLPVPDAVTRSDLDGLATRADLDELSRQIATVAHNTTAAPTAATDRRSAAEIVQAAAKGDEEARALITSYASRAYEGGVIGDDGQALVPAFVADLTRIIDNANPLAALFGTAPLPAEGMSIEFSELATNTLTVGKQEAEGDALKMGKVTTKTRTAPIQTFGGWSQLSVQEVQRSRANMLQLTLKGMAIEAGKAKATTFAQFYADTVATQTANGLSITKQASALAWADLAAILSDASDKFTELAVPITGLIVDAPTWKALASLTGTDGRPMLSVSGAATNTAGTLNPAGLSADLARIPVIKNTRQTSGPAGCFFADDALRTYTSGVASLTDQDIVSLVNSFSVYYYAAFAAEIPGHLVPLSLGAPAGS